MNNRPWRTLYKNNDRQMKEGQKHFSKYLGIPKFREDTDFTIGGFLAGPPRSPLTVCSSLQVFNQIIIVVVDIRNIQPTGFVVHHQILSMQKNRFDYCEIQNAEKAFRFGV